MAQGSPPSNVIRPSQFSASAGGSGPTDPTVEARLAGLEVSVAEMRKDLQAIRLEIARIDGKISNLPTTFQLVFMQAGFILAVFVAAFGLSFALLRFAPPH